MHARATLAQFKPGMADEATHIFRDIMLPRAKEQQGFKHALILGNRQTDKRIIITIWETEADLIVSAPPEDILPDLERLGEMIADSSQDILDVLFEI